VAAQDIWDIWPVKEGRRHEFLGAAARDQFGAYNTIDGTSGYGRNLFP
jgi:hypothetical protein